MALCRGLHLAHFVFSRHARFAHSVFHIGRQRIIAPGSRAPIAIRRAGRAGPEDPAAEEEDGLQLAVAASPHAQADGGGGGGEHGEPPHGVAREGARVEACEEEVEEVDCEGEVGDEFAARDEDDHGERPGDEKNKMLASFDFTIVFLREIKVKTVLYAHAKAAVENPHKGQEPSLRRIAADAIPPENEVEVERNAGDQGGEEHEDEGGKVVEGLEAGYLGGDFERLELCEGAGARGPASAGHCAFYLFISLSFYLLILCLLLK